MDGDASPTVAPGRRRRVDPHQVVVPVDADLAADQDVGTE
jgi:hypothetical protein